MKITATVLFVFAIAIPAHAEVFYNIDFESPVHSVGAVPDVGIGIDTPSEIRFGDPKVMQGFGAISSQCLVFNQTVPEYDQIRLDLGKDQDYYFLSFDISTRNLDNSLSAFTINFDTPYVRNIYFNGKGMVRPFAPYSGVNTYGYDFNNETLMHVTAEIDLRQEKWEIKINDRLAVDGKFYGSDIESIRFNLSTSTGAIDYEPSVYVAIDNIFVSNVPEPCSLVLLSLGGLILRRRVN